MRNSAPSAFFHFVYRLIFHTHARKRKKFFVRLYRMRDELSVAEQRVGRVNVFNEGTSDNFYGRKRVNLLISKHVDAVIASNNLLASGVLAGARKASVSVPKELRVIGYNDSVICECAYPTLTGIDNFSAQTCG